MAKYKPLFSQALEAIGLRLKGSLDRETIRTAMGGHRVLASPVHALMDFPPSRRAGMDGTTVVGVSPGGNILTGETVDSAVEWIVMEEERLSSGERGRRAPTVTHVREVGSEYRQGDLLANVGDVVTPALISQALVLGIAQLPVFERPVVRVVVVGEGEAADAAMNWLTGSLAERFPFEVNGSKAASVEELPEAISCKTHLLLVASDGAPGRYREMRTLYTEPPSWFRPDFWKVEAYPCRHLGFGRTGQVPTLILPDILYKTTLGAALIAPYMSNALFAMAPPAMPVITLSQPVTVPGPFPYVVPVARPAPGDSRWHPLATDNMFSGRQSVQLDGLAVWKNVGEPPLLLTFGFSRT